MCTVFFIPINGRKFTLRPVNDNIGIVDLPVSENNNVQHTIVEPEQSEQQEQVNGDSCQMTCVIRSLRS